MLSIQNPTAKAVRHLVAQNFSLSKALPPMITKLSKERHSIIHQMTVLFVTIDDFLTQHHEWRQWRRSPNCRPAFADSEVLTIALLQGCFKVATCEIAEQFARLKHAYQIIATDFATAFPRLPSYSQFVARLHALQSLVGRLIQQVLPPLYDDVYLMDSKPIPLCKPIRHVGFSRRKSLAQGTPFARGRSLFWQEQLRLVCRYANAYFGFKLHVIAHRTGTIFCAFLTPANTPDQDAALALAQATDGGTLLADRAYQTNELQTQFGEQADLLLITPKNCGEANRALISSLRERIETTFSQLHDRFITNCHRQF